MKHTIGPILLLAALAGCRQHFPTAVDYTLNDSCSRAYWKGSAPDHSHIGSFTVKGSLGLDSTGRPATGDFLIPIASIDNFDLSAALKPLLLNHLKGKDFFDMAVNPVAHFHLLSAEPMAGASGHYLLSGRLSMAGQTHLLSFPATVRVAGDSVLAAAAFDLDRTKWGINSFSDSSAKLYIRPNVNIRLDIHAGKRANPKKGVVVR